MGWVQKFLSEDFLCFENKTKAVSCRIESRKTDDGWIIYKSYFSPQGINHTEEYVAPTYDKMNQIISALQREKQPTVDQIRQLILSKSKKVRIQIEREYKEYGVEKWKFGINGDPNINFALVRCYEEIDIDFVIHEAYKYQEQSIVKELVDMLGFDGMEDILNINCYYFNKHVTKVLQAPEREDAIDL